MPWRSSCTFGARFLVPDLESVRPDRAIGMGGKLVTAGAEVTIDERVGGEEVLGLFGRFEPLHLPFPSSRWPVRVLGPIMQISALPMLDGGKQLTLSDAVAPQLVGHDHPRDILQTLQKPPEEALRGVPIAPGLNEDVENNAILIDGAPEIVLHALDPDEHLVEMPLVPWSWPVASQAIGETRAEFLAPAAHRLVGDNNAALSQDQLNIAPAEAEYVIQPHGLADDLGGKPMAVVRVGWRLHAASLARP
jgi:hypothetical protein